MIHVKYVFGNDEYMLQKFGVYKTILLQYYKTF